VKLSGKRKNASWDGTGGDKPTVETDPLLAKKDKRRGFAELCSTVKGGGSRRRTQRTKKRIATVNQGRGCWANGLMSNEGGDPASLGMAIGLQIGGTKAKNPNTAKRGGNEQWHRKGENDQTKTAKGVRQKSNYSQESDGTRG